MRHLPELSNDRRRHAPADIFPECSLFIRSPDSRTKGTQIITMTELLPLEQLRQWRRAIWRYYVFGLRRHLPKRLRLEIGRLFGKYIFWRVSPDVTRVFGPRYRRSRDRIDIDITWECNLNCFHCNRSCQQAPTEEMMTVKQVLFLCLRRFQS